MKSFFLFVYNFIEAHGTAVIVRIINERRWGQSNDTWKVTEASAIAKIAIAQMKKM